MKVKELKNKIILAELDPNADYIMLVSECNVCPGVLEGLLKSARSFKSKIYILWVTDVDKAVRFVKVPKGQEEQEKKEQALRRASEYIIEESHKYKGCYNIYDKYCNNRVKYFAENDDKNYKRAVEWIKDQTKII